MGLGGGTSGAHGFGMGFKLRGQIAPYAVSIGMKEPVSYNITGMVGIALDAGACRRLTAERSVLSSSFTG